MTLKEDQAEMRARMQALKSTRRKSRVGMQPETKIMQTPSAKSASPIELTTTKSDPREAPVGGPATRKCETCGRPTSNPRFCSRSCAAVTNNAASPKRRPEGECQRCQTTISRSKRYCEACHRGRTDSGQDNTSRGTCFDTRAAAKPRALSRVNTRGSLAWTRKRTG